MVGKYLIASYLYYVLDYSIMEDTEFDLICKELLENIDRYRKHPHGYLLNEDALRAGTGHHLTEMDYPRIVKITGAMIKDFANRGIDYFKWVEEGCHAMP